MLARGAVALLAFGLAAVSADAQIRIGLRVSATGPTSAIGIPQKNTGDILPRSVGGASIEYVSLEDGGDATRAVQNAKKLIQEHRIDALIGPSTTPNAFAILDVIADAKVPLMATVGTSAVVEPLDAKKRWVFKTTQNDDLMAAAPIRHMVKHGVKSVGFIGFNDPYGENWLKLFGALGEKAGVTVVAVERYARTDASVTGQTLKLISAKPGTEAFRSALRDALENGKEVIGRQGVFNISASNHNGMDERARVLITIRNGKFRLLSE